MWSEDSFIVLQRRRSCQWHYSAPAFHRRDKRLRCPLMVRDCHSRTASANVAPRLPSPPPYSTRWLGNINYNLHAALARVQLECGGLLNVSALCFHFWLNHQITVCLRSQVRRFLLCQAGVLPRLSLSSVNLCLVASGDKHQRQRRWLLLSRPWNAAPPPQRVTYAVQSNIIIISNPRDEKLRWVQTPTIFLRSLSVYLTPVDFGSH